MVYDGQVTLGELLGEVSLPGIVPEMMHKGDVAWRIDHTIWVNGWNDKRIRRIVVAARKGRLDFEPKLERDGRWCIGWTSVGGDYVGFYGTYHEDDGLYSRKPTEADLRAWWSRNRSKYAAKMAPDAEIIFDASGKHRKDDNNG